MRALMIRRPFLDALHSVKVEGRPEKQELEVAVVFGMVAVVWDVAVCLLLMEEIRVKTLMGKRQFGGS